MPQRISLEAADSLSDRHILARHTGELLCNMERLREEVLDLTGTGNGQLVLVGQLIHAEDGDDILQILVLLQNGLHRTATS